MKLLFCFECGDVKKLTRVEVRKCKCGKSRGRYLPDGNNVWVNRGTLVLAIDNNELSHAMMKRLCGGDARVDISCWLFEKDYHRISVLEDTGGLI